MLGLKLNHVSKRGHCWAPNHYMNHWWPSSLNHVCVIRSQSVHEHMFQSIGKRHICHNSLLTYGLSLVSIVLTLRWGLFFPTLTRMITITFGIQLTNRSSTHNPDLFRIHSVTLLTPLSSGSKPQNTGQPGYEFAHTIADDTLRPRQNGRHFAHDIFMFFFIEWKCLNSRKFSLNFVPKVPIINIKALVQIMAWRRPGDKPLSEAMIVSLLTHICVTRSQWVKLSCLRKIFTYCRLLSKTF